MRQVLETLHSFGPKVVIITSIMIGNECYLYGSSLIENIVFKIHIPNYRREILTGTGDVFASILLCHLQTYNVSDAAVFAVDTMQAIIDRTLRTRTRGLELALIQSADLILNPTPKMHFATFL